MSDDKSHLVRKPDVFEELSKIDTSKYVSHPMVEKLLVARVGELEVEKEKLSREYELLRERYVKLQVTNVKYQENSKFNFVIDIIRNISVIGLGITGTITYSSSPDYDVGAVLIGVFCLAAFIASSFTYYHKSDSIQSVEVDHG